MSETTAWRLVAVLSVLSAGAALGNEAAQYFWDATAYVQALDSPYPYRLSEPYPFLYPPFAADLFTMARSHLFEFISIASVAAAALFLRVFAQTNLPRQFEWLMAITAMGGLGVVSLLAGNVGLPMNLTLLAVALHAAMGTPMAIGLLPIVIGVGALIKPQFALYLGLLLCLERSRMTAVAKSMAVVTAVALVHASYILFRPYDWNEYIEAVLKRTAGEKDFGWGPAALATRFSDANTAAAVGYAVVFMAACGLAYMAWRKSVRSDRQLPPVFVVSLAFVVLTFANPRVPLYDVYAAAIALVICCAMAPPAPGMAWTLVAALAINFLPWLIANFTRAPSAWPWWIQDLQITHLVGIASLFVALSRTGIQHTAAAE